MADGDARAFSPIDRVVLEEIFLGGNYSFRVYEPEGTLVVLGRSGREEEDVLVENCRADGVPVVRRAGGGGTVVLSAGMVVVSVAGRTPIAFHLREHMNAVNETVIAALERLGVGGLTVRGFSDIALGDRKVAGSSLYRTRDIVLYQGSLLVSPERGIFDRYLRHPKKEPDYRGGRSHGAFLTDLNSAGYALVVEQVIAAISDALSRGAPWPLEKT